MRVPIAGLPADDDEHDALQRMAFVLSLTNHIAAVAAQELDMPATGRGQHGAPLARPAAA